MQSKKINKSTANLDENSTEHEKLPTSKLAKQLKMNTKQLNDKLAKIGYIERLEDGFELTELGKINGGEEKKNAHCTYFIWNSNMKI